jgi:site-specific DNA-methyltransferase (adenine-specific)
MWCVQVPTGAFVARRNGQIFITGNSGFPKSMNLRKALEARQKLGNTDLAKQWEGWGTALKPAHEPIIVARKPFKGSLVENIMNYGVGGINIDECRIDYNGEIPNIGGRAKHTRGDGYGFKPLGENCVANTSGRFPANVIHDGSDEVESLFPYTKSGKMTSEHQRHTDGSPNGIYGKFDKEHPLSETYGDSGSASRFFYCAKASQKDRDEGLEIAASTINETPRKNTHPTVKPCELMQYLVRLVTPKGGIILDPFMGSGSTGKACMFENRERQADYKFIGIDLEEEYCNIASARIDYALNKYKYDYQQELKKAKEKGQLSLF